MTIAQNFLSAAQFSTKQAQNFYTFVFGLFYYGGADDMELPVSLFLLSRQFYDIFD